MAQVGSSWPIVSRVWSYAEMTLVLSLTCRLRTILIVG
jgi:hypothetical protein